MRTSRPRGCKGRDTVMRTHAQASADGFSFVEIVVAVMLAALALAISFAVVNARPQYLGADVQDFFLNLQAARELGISRGTHYRVRLTSQTAYVLEIQGAIWATDRSINLRPNVQFAAGDVTKVVEFDTRGLCVSALCISSPPVTYTLSDVVRGWSKQVTVNPQGMVDRP